MKVRFIITPKVNLPNYHGDILKEELKNIEPSSIENIIVGKVLIIKLNETDKTKVREISDNLINKILINHEIEDCIYEILEDL